MSHLQLVISDREGARLGQVSVEGRGLVFSDDTDELVQDAVDYVVNHEKHVLFERNGKLVHAELSGEKEGTLQILGDYLTSRFGFRSVIERAGDGKVRRMATAAVAALVGRFRS